LLPDSGSTAGATESVSTNCVAIPNSVGPTDGSASTASLATNGRSSCPVTGDVESGCGGTDIDVPNEGGGWAAWDPDSLEAAKAYGRLLAPDRRFFVVGDQVSQLPGWQEGAMMSAQHVVEQIGGRRLLTVPKIKRAPNTRRLTRGRT